MADHVLDKKQKKAEEANVLLVEDSFLNRIFAQELLKKLGFKKVDVAENGEEAIKKFVERCFDLILMDCQMPIMDGYITTQKIRQIEVSANDFTPIIALTANDLSGDREKCLEAGMNDYIGKPLKEIPLRSVLQKWFVIDSERLQNFREEGLLGLEEPPIDLQRLRLFTDGNWLEEEKLIGSFLEHADVATAELKTAILQNNPHAWYETAHRLKGASGNMGAAQLHRLFQYAEEHADALESQKTEMLSDICQAVLRVRAYLDAENHNHS